MRLSGRIENNTIGQQCVVSHKQTASNSSIYVWSTWSCPLQMIGSRRPKSIGPQEAKRRHGFRRKALVKGIHDVGLVHKAGPPGHNHRPPDADAKTVYAFNHTGEIHGMESRIRAIGRPTYGAKYTGNVDR